MWRWREGVHPSACFCTLSSSSHSERRGRLLTKFFSNCLAGWLGVFCKLLSLMLVACRALSLGMVLVLVQLDGVVCNGGGVQDD